MRSVTDEINTSVVMGVTSPVILSCSPEPVEDVPYPPKMTLVMDLQIGESGAKLSGRKKKTVPVHGLTHNVGKDST
jgi:hypothetical protein